MTPETAFDPWVLFDLWFQSAVDGGLARPDAMTLATIGLDGRPSARIVLYKGRSEGGLRFFTNYESRKGAELARVPWAAAVFFWAEFERQVRIEGAVAKLADAESDAYFETRPRDSQLGAWASPQSQPLGSREQLEQRLAELREEYAERQVVRPPHWGGYRLIPDSFEFWTAAAHRLNERWLFRRTGSGWQRSALAP
jgi:pyridoxamine 5'-phosphate oxidase